MGLAGSATDGRDDGEANLDGALGPVSTWIAGAVKAAAAEGVPGCQHLVDSVLAGKSVEKAPQRP